MIRPLIEVSCSDSVDDICGIGDIHDELRPFRRITTEQGPNDANRCKVLDVPLWIAGEELRIRRQCGAAFPRSSPDTATVRLRIGHVDEHTKDALCQPVLPSITCHPPLLMTPYRARDVDSFNDDRIPFM